VQQIRRRDAVPKGFDPKSMTENEIRSVCNRALQLDALCPLAWFNLGGVAQRAGDAEVALDAYLIAALIQRGDVESWANAFAIALNAAKAASQPIENADPTAVLAIVAGYRANGEDFLNASCGAHCAGRPA